VTRMLVGCTLPAAILPITRKPGGNMLRPHWLWLALFLACVGPASAQLAVPTDNELRTAYCIPVVKAQIEIENQAIAMAEGQRQSPTPEAQNLVKEIPAMREDLAKRQTALDRLQLYLLPKMQALDPIALTAAMHRGDADVLELKASAQRCAAKCTSAPDWNACISQCNPDLSARVKACANPTWLPF